MKRPMYLKILFVGFVMFDFVATQAQNTLYLQYDKSQIGNNSHIRVLPIVDYDNFVVSVNSTALISNVKIVITDT